uniref:TetR/AcrR family transcriptional regulator n=1 Tax=Rhodococcus qingshengii TaxID=334542 RepID=UPI001C4DFC4D|nr:TetR/AcrR family transcriptional regulator [Rhodococcus qingshengii]
MRISTVDRRDQLLDAAIVVLRRDGVDKASLRAIASEAGASLAAVHVCFVDKNELMSAAAGRYLGGLVEEMSKGIPPREGIRSVGERLMDAFWNTLTDDPMTVLAQMEIGAWCLRRENSLLGTIYDRYEQEITALLDEAGRLTDQRSEISTSLLARGLVAIMDGAILQTMANGSLTEHRLLFETMVGSLLDRAGLPLGTVAATR